MKWQIELLQSTPQSNCPFFTRSANSSSDIYGAVLGDAVIIDNPTNPNLYVINNNQIRYNLIYIALTMDVDESVVR
jgi:hypothetical protein